MDGQQLGRTMWKGIVLIGERRIPVKLFTAIRSETIPFHLLHRSDGVRLKQAWFCKEEKVQIPPEEVVRGFEISEWEYVIVDDSDLEKADPSSSREISILDFIPMHTFDRRYLEKNYILSPDGSDKEFYSLAGSLSSLDHGAIVRWVMRKKTYLGLLEYYKGVLWLRTLRYADEVTPLASIPLEAVSFTPKEEAMARQLVMAMVEEFDPGRYKNSYVAEMRELIAKKASGESIPLAPEVGIEETPASELEKALEKSLGRVKGAA